MPKKLTKSDEALETVYEAFESYAHRWKIYGL